MMRARHGRRRALAAIAVVALAALPVNKADPVAAAPARSGRTSGAPTWITLLTGDRVALTERDGDLDVLTVVPGPGRQGTGFRQQRLDGRLHVVPADAIALVGDGRLDRRLFDVTTLVRFGYDDASRDDLPLIVSGATAAPAGARAQATVTRDLPSLSAVAVSEPKAGAGTFWAGVTRAPAGAPRALAPEVARIWLDGPVQADLDTSVGRIGAPAAWAAGHTGDGAVVAVLDTGIDPDHPDLAGAVVESRDFTGNPAGPVDGHGHGTHVASIVTGDGAASDGRYRGVAPDARLLAGKVLDDAGNGLESDIIAGMEWAAAADVDAVNLSLGNPWPGDGTEPMDQAVDHLTATTGTLFVVAAGNAGPGEATVSSPGSADAALTVGAVDDQDRLADFSSRGPRPGRRAIKPDVTAPGVGIVAARAEGTTMGEPVDEHHTEADGTSMATPHVAGAAAILAGQHPDWDADRLKAVLMGSAEPQAEQSVYAQGAGRIDVGRADAQPVSAAPASIDGGLARWPHDDDAPVVTPVTYRNDGSEPLTLALDMAVRDPAGDPAPAAMFEVSADRAVVPPNGEVTVELRIDTAVAGPDGRYEGHLRATGAAGLTVVTPVAVDREVESYDVTVSVLDRTGRPSPSYSAVLVGLDEPTLASPYDPAGPAVARVPKGRYAVDVLILAADPDAFLSQAIVFEPTFTVEADTTFVADAREARPAGATVDREDAAIASVSALMLRETAIGTYASGTLFSPPDVYLRPSATSAPADEFEVEVRTLLARPDGDGGFAGSPYLYGIAWTASRRVPGRVMVHRSDRDLARVRASYAKTSPGQSFGSRDGVLRMELPAVVDERYTPGVPWVADFVETGPTGEIWGILAAERTYRPGKQRERWNAAVFGPADPGPARPFDQVTRTGDTLDIVVPLFSDQTAGHFGPHSPTTSARTTLEQDGERVLEVPALPFDLQAPATPDEAVYRLTADATRDLVDLSTAINVTWTFRSARPDGDRTAPVPLLGVRFAPDVDGHNGAPSGTRFTVPLHIGRQAGSGDLEEVTVEASFDDGGTWQPLRVKGRGDDRKVTIDHPTGPGFVSLRATAADADGNRVEQTIIHAYRLTG